MVFRKLPKPITKTLQSSSTLLPPVPNSNLINKPEPLNIPLPTVSLSQTSQQELFEFLKSHLKPSFTPHNLFNFLHKKLHYHPRFTQFDVHIFRWASEIDAFRHDHFTYEWMVRTLAITDRLNDLNSVLEDIVQGLCLERKMNEALELVGELLEKGKILSPVICTTLIDSLLKSGMVEDAFVLMERMLKLGIVPDSVTYNYVLREMCGLGRTMDANRLRLLASSKSLDPDGMTYNILVSGFSREGRKKEGEGIVERMLDEGFIPDLATYNRLVDGLSNKNKAVCSVKKY
ncbi:hypothetical protein MKX01_013633 [Papaver californicum]|nr:hypothetical protein MKX01_013633 [Papaver californicum]